MLTVAPPDNWETLPIHEQVLCLLAVYKTLEVQYWYCKSEISNIESTSNEPLSISQLQEVSRKRGTMDSCRMQIVMTIEEITKRVIPKGEKFPTSGVKLEDGTIIKFISLSQIRIQNPDLNI